MQNKIISKVIILWFLGTPFLLGQDIKMDEIPFDMDVARFRASDDWSYLEVYFSIPREKLDYRKKDDHYQSDFRIQVEVFSKDSLAARYQRDISDQIDSLGSLRVGQYIYDQASFYLREGNYSIRGGVLDLFHKTENWTTRELIVVPFSRDSLSLSDVQLAVQIQPDTSQKKFVKNGYRIIPNPRHLYGIELPILYYYVEIYNLSPLSDGVDSTYAVKISILDAKENSVKSLEPINGIRRGASLIEIRNVYIGDLVSNTYQLRLDVTDGASGECVSKEIPFNVYREIDFMRKGQSDVTVSPMINTEFSVMEEEEVDEQFELCNYIATQQEKKRYNKLTLTGKREFMKQFWQIRDEDIFTPENAYKRDYLERVAYANSNFSSYYKKGWKTDRGRILLQYGMPDEIERFPSEISGKAYQIWHYFKIQGGIRFYFVDVRSYGVMRLVHSTSRNEIHDFEWQRFLQL
jgi:GWxTD domain-containing protein